MRVNNDYMRLLKAIIYIRNRVSVNIHLLLYPILVKLCNSRGLGELSEIYYKNILGLGEES